MIYCSAKLTKKRREKNVQSIKIHHLMELHFVYNANNDAISKLSDYVHKLVSPSTYKCDLCAITHHNFGMRSSWKNFIVGTSVEMKFWYIEAFEAAFDTAFKYPVVLEKTDNNFKIVLEKGQLASIKDAVELIKLITFHIDQTN
jgi:hypothetical protein